MLVTVWSSQIENDDFEEFFENLFRRVYRVNEWPNARTSTVQAGCTAYERPNGLGGFPTFRCMQKTWAVRLV